jgi:L,D-transpeptidase-like protein
MKLHHGTSKLLIGSTALLIGTAGFQGSANTPAAPHLPQANQANLTAPVPVVPANVEVPTGSGTSARAKTALTALSSAVRRLSDPRALKDAFNSYFAFKAAHPTQVKKPYLYFVDYGLPNTAPRGYVFDMAALKVVDGPFTVAHGRGSGASIPTRFSNAIGSAATSLGLYIAKATYAFTGHASGRPYRSIGLKLDGVSRGFNDKAFTRGVVAHGAPYVTPSRAGMSKGCPAMEPARAQQLLPKLADGGMVFLFAPDAKWMSSDPWLDAGY